MKIVSASADSSQQQTVSVIAHATTLQESWSFSVSFTRVFVTRHAPNQRRPWERGWPLPDFSLNMASNRGVIQTIFEEYNTENDI